MQLFLKTVMPLLIVAVSVTVYYFMSNNDGGYPVFGKDRLSSIRVFEDHKEALYHWCERGIKDAILVNIDTHDDFKRIQQGKLQNLKTNLGQTAQKNSVSDRADDNNIVANGNFIYAAAKLGIVKKVYWIVPAPIFQTHDKERQLGLFLRHHRFLDKDIRTFRLHRESFKGQIDDIPVTICGIETLPDISRPILLSIDADFVPLLAQGYKVNYIDSVIKLFSALSDKQYKILDALVAYSVNEGHLPARHRWIGDLLVDMLYDPEMGNNKIPGRYHLLQRAEMLAMMGRTDDLFEYLLPVAENTPEDPAIMLYLAHAFKFLGLFQYAYSYAESACINDIESCHGLLEIGIDVLRNSGLSDAEKFFLRAYQLNPDMVHGQFILAIALKKAGRYDDAIKYFKVFQDNHGIYPAGFYLGQTYQQQGREDDALRCFNHCRIELVNNPYAWSEFGDINIIRDVIEFYEKKGMHGHAEELKQSVESGASLYPDIFNKMM